MLLGVTRCCGKLGDQLRPLYGLYTACIVRAPAAVGALKQQVKTGKRERKLAWKTHRTLAARRGGLEAAKVEMEKLAEDIVDLEQALDYLAFLAPAQYAAWRWRRNTTAVLAGTILRSVNFEAVCIFLNIL